MNKKIKKLWFILGHFGVVVINTIFFFLLNRSTCQLIVLLISIPIFILQLVCEFLSLKFCKKGIEELVGDEEVNIHTNRRQGILMLFHAALLLASAGTIIASAVLLFL